MSIVLSGYSAAPIYFITHKAGVQLYRKYIYNQGGRKKDRYSIRLEYDSGRQFLLDLLRKAPLLLISDIRIFADRNELIHKHLLLQSLPSVLSLS